MYEIKVKKARYEDIKIGDNVFKIDVSPEGFAGRAAVWPEIIKKVHALLATDTPLTQKSAMLLDLYRWGINATFEGNPADEILAMCNGDMTVLSEVLSELQGVLRDVAVKHTAG